MALTKVSTPLIKSLGAGDPGQVLTADTNGEFNWVAQDDLSVGSANYAQNAGTAGYAGSAGSAGSATSAQNSNYANYASFAGVATSANSVGGSNVAGAVSLADKVANSNQSNITQVGNLVTLSVSGNTTIYGNLDVKGNVTYVESNVVTINDINITIGNNAANAAQANGGGITLNGANAEMMYLATNDSWNFNKQLVGNLTGTASTANLATYATTANAVDGSNVTGTVANATYAASADTANSATTATTANSVAAANITGTISFATSSTNANVALVAYSVAAANVTGTVANATYAATAGSATSADTANSATIAASANSVALANVTGIGNIANINLNGNGSQALLGNGSWGNVSGGGGTTISNWTLANSYSNGALVIYNTTIWQAQSNIAANTAFVSGNVANTWTALTSGISTKTDTFTATAGQTAFTATVAPSGSVSFYINGMMIAATAVSVSNVTVTYNKTYNGNYTLLAGDIVTISYSYGTSGASLGTTTIANLTVSGTSTLGAVANVSITGGSNGQVLVTNGSGTLTWGNAAPTVTLKVQEVVANAAQTSFSISSTPLGNVAVSINGATIRPGAISVSNTTVTYTAANNYSYTIEANDSVIFAYITSS